MDSPVSQTLADRERITMRSLPLLFLSLRLSSSLLVLLSDRPFVRPFVRSSVRLSACPSARLLVCLLSLSSPASRRLSHQEFISSLSCPVLPCPSQLLLLFLPSLAPFPIFSLLAFRSFRHSCSPTFSPSQPLLVIARSFVVRSTGLS